MIFDVLEVSPTSGDGNKKVVVIVYLFTHYMMAISIHKDSAERMVGVLFERWIYVYGPPVRPLSDQGNLVVSGIARKLCTRTGT